MKKIKNIPVENTEKFLRKECERWHINANKFIRSILTDLTKYHNDEFYEWFTQNYLKETSKKIMRLWKLKFFIDNFQSACKQIKVVLIKDWQRKWSTR